MDTTTFNPSPPITKPPVSPSGSPKTLTPMVLVQYNENSYAIYGTQSTLYKEELMDAPLFGKYNRNLRDGPGWIFSKKRKEALEQFIATVNKK